VVTTQAANNRVLNGLSAGTTTIGVTPRAIAFTLASAIQSHLGRHRNCRRNHSHTENIPAEASQQGPVNMSNSNNNDWEISGKIANGLTTPASATTTASETP